MIAKQLIFLNIVIISGYLQAGDYAALNRGVLSEQLRQESAQKGSKRKDGPGTQKESRKAKREAGFIASWKKRGVPVTFYQKEDSLRPSAKRQKIN
jgi:hypothetical protein